MSGPDLQAMLHPSLFDIIHAMVMGAGLHWYWMTRPNQTRLPKAQASEVGRVHVGAKVKNH